jgi:hypothetical protein
VGKRQRPLPRSLYRATVGFEYQRLAIPQDRMRHLCVDISSQLRKGPLTGHLLVAVVIRCTVCGAVELEDGVDPDFPDSLRD